MFRNAVVRDFLTGLFALGAIAGLCAILVLFGEIAEFGASYYRFTVVLPSASGLGSTSPVMVNGVKVGQIEKAEVSPEGAALTVKIKREVRVPRSAVLSVEKGLIGDASLEFTIPPGSAMNLRPEEYIVDGATLVAPVAGSFFDRLAESIQKPLDRLSASADKIDALASAWTTTGQRLNDLLESRSLADVESGKAPNIASTIERLDRALASADTWLRDEQIRSGVKDILARAGVVLGDMQSFLTAWTETADSVDLAAQHLDQAAGEISVKTNELAAQAMQTLRRVDAAAAELGKSIEAANKGEGTVGQLLTNPDLYKSLTGSAQRLERVLVELQLLVEQMKAEGVKIKL
ncbi:MAG: hypothetical protein HBSAPP03_11750 [Phycisphaerae bacterium]|nr:MAG: hypothetical protein HBSAPP03_11750 [Phycisphaerae bacterium]